MESKFWRSIWFILITAAFVFGIFRNQARADEFMPDWLTHSDAVAHNIETDEIHRLSELTEGKLKTSPMRVDMTSAEIIDYWVNELKYIKAQMLEMGYKVVGIQKGSIIVFSYKELPPTTCRKLDEGSKAPE